MLILSLLTHWIDGYFFSPLDELPDLAPQQVELYVAGEEIANGKGWEEGECVGGLDMTVTGVSGEILTLNVHTKPVGDIMYFFIVYTTIIVEQK